MLARDLPESMRDGIEFFDADRYNAAATLQDNILLGKVAHGHAHASDRVADLIGEVVDTVDARRQVIEVGLDHQVGIGGGRLGLLSQGFAQGGGVAWARLTLDRDTRAAFEQTIFGDTRGLAFDGTGRVSLPRDLIEHAGLEGKAAFVGLGSRFEIWNPDRLAERKKNARSFARENKTSLRLPPRSGGGS